MRFIPGNYRSQYDVAVGLGVQIASFKFDEGNARLFKVNGIGLILRATWLPHERNVRIDGALDLSIIGGDEVNTRDCDPMNCRGYILPDEVDAPTQLVDGVAYRIGPTAWTTGSRRSACKSSSAPAETPPTRC